MRIRNITIITLCWLLCVGLLPNLAESQTVMSVQVKEAQLRSAPSFLGKLVSTVAYATQVEVLEKKGDWRRVVLVGSTTEGWMHSSALSKKKITLKAGVEDVSNVASSDEVALAGKGFNANVEKQYKTENPDLNYQAVDKMEKVVISQQQMQKFLEQGNLHPEGGSQ